MPGYRFTAYDLNGQEQRGVLESDSPRLARAQLREKGWFPLDVTVISATDGSVRQRRRTALNVADLARITRQFATLLGAGLTVEQTFNAVVEQAESESERQLLAGLRAGVREGKSLADSLAAYPDTFSGLYRTLVAAGESSGKLPQVLERLASYVEDQHALRQRLLVAMLYPSIVMLVCILVVTGLMIYVVPQVVGVFAATRQTLPLMTRMLLATSHFLSQTWWIWLLLGAAAGIGARAALQRERMRQRWHQVLLRVPVLGRTIRAREAAQLAATLAILVGSGVPVMTALQAANGVVGNLPMREALRRATAAVREGSGLARALSAQQPGKGLALFPSLLVHLIASGEASGRLPETLEAAARQQQRDVESRTAMLATLIEPLMILFMGGVVLCIVLAILLPIFELNQLVAR